MDFYYIQYTKPHLEVLVLPTINEAIHIVICSWSINLQRLMQDIYVEVYCGHRDQLIYLQLYIFMPSRQQSQIPKKLNGDTAKS
jgi:hypothetical protein